MATTRIMPLHVGKGRTESRAISDIIDYVANPKKTDNGRLITGYACDSRTADAEFLLAKRQYLAATGRVRGADDVIAYHVRQSFRPGEITPEEANRLGVEFAKRFTKGNHAFVVCTHIDKSHIHNHIIWSSVSLEYDRKFRNFWGSTKAVRRLSDTITNLIHASVDPKTVQYLAGHESSKITMDIYAKVKYNRPDELVRSMSCAFASWDAAQ